MTYSAMTRPRMCRGVDICTAVLQLFMSVIEQSPMGTSMTA